VATTETFVPIDGTSKLVLALLATEIARQRDLEHHNTQEAEHARRKLADFETALSCVSRWVGPPDTPDPRKVLQASAISLGLDPDLVPLEDLDAPRTGVAVLLRTSWHGGTEPHGSLMARTRGGWTALATFPKPEFVGELLAEVLPE
jgi:hypothetical protein